MTFGLATMGTAADLLLVGTVRTLVDGQPAGALAVRDAGRRISSRLGAA